MKNVFTEPDFSDGIIECRVDGDEISIYATPDGLRWLAQKCLALADAHGRDHVHLEDYQILTSSSNRVTLAKFPSQPI